MKTVTRFVAVFAALAFALFASGANAQGNASNVPTIAQIYQAANSGQMDRADSMIEQVLKNHPNSAKAHYVKAELAARERKVDVAKQELAAAEKIAPGLPFAKAESVQALRNQIANATKSASAQPQVQSQAQPQAPVQARRMGAPAERSFPWGTLAIVAAIVLIGMAVLRRRSVPPPNQGYAGGGYGDAPVPPYGPAGYGGMPPQQPSMGSSMARGLGTGLAVGAGVLAAEEIGRRMFGHEANAAQVPHDGGNTPSLDQLDEGMRHNLNTDMGGNDFGIADDGGGWDDGGAGGGGDWDT